MNSKQKILIGILVIVYLVTFAANFIFATVKLGYELPFTLVYYKTPDDVYKLHYEGEADEECFRMGNRLLDLGREYDLIPRIQWRKGEGCVLNGTFSETMTDRLLSYRKTSDKPVYYNDGFIALRLGKVTVYQYKDETAVHYRPAKDENKDFGLYIFNTNDPFKRDVLIRTVIGEFLTDGHAPTYKGMSAVHAILVIHSIETPFFLLALSAVLLKSSKKNESEV